VTPRSVHDIEDGIGSTEYDIIVVMYARGTMLYDVLRHVRPLVLNSARVVEAALHGDGLTVGTRAVLEMLTECGPLTVPDIADRLDLARQGVQRHVNDLIALGHAESRPNPAHRRSALIATTAAGAALFTRIRAHELSRLDRMATGCTDEEIATALRVLAALNRDVRAEAQR
jgi:DNA-binding MarR family transcriptional regulator